MGIEVQVNFSGLKFLNIHNIHMNNYRYLYRD